MIWIVGAIFDKIVCGVNRCRAKHTIHSFGKHGRNVHIEEGCTISASNVYVGDNVFIGANACLLSSKAKIIMGNNIMLGPNVSIVTGNHRIDIVGKLMIDVKDEDKRQDDDQDVIIEDDCWIGMGVTILKGVHIGKGSVIGAGTILCKDVEPYSIVIDERVKKVKKRFTQQEINMHEKMIKELNKDG